jgi:hypothetical protein
MFDMLARTFPVACASDEFPFFPQWRRTEPQWSTWDCFSPETVADVVRQLSAWEDELGRLDAPELELAVRIDIALLRKLAHTLREQLAEVRTWEVQPTFYLTLAGIGLAEAIASADPAAGHERARGLPAFLEQSGRNLNRVPVLFRDIGLEMVADTRNYLLSLVKTLPELPTAITALDRFGEALRKVDTRRDFRLPRELLARVLRAHINCGLDVPEINETLDREIEEMLSVLSREAGNLSSDTVKRSPPSWSAMLKSIPIPAVGKDGLLGLYRDEINKLTEHCLAQGLVSPGLVAACPVRVTPMPSFLAAIRTGASYSMPPGYLPAGGTFYIVNTHMPSTKAQAGYLRQYRMTCAHETYPGHHLLDASRWGLARPLRRAVEQPIFYEGWACFAEEVLRQTGYFHAPGDRLLLAWRRLLHAVRCQVDIGLQTGKMTVPAAVGYLAEAGLSTERAVSLARKYPLNPGYQLCYTLGLRRFLDLLARYGHDNLPDFVWAVLNQGEINFTDLEKVLRENRQLTGHHNSGKGDNFGAILGLSFGMEPGESGGLGLPAYYPENR